MNSAKEIALAFNAYEKGDLAQAKELCGRILLKSPNDPDILHLSGIIHYRLKNYVSGITYIKKALDADPEFVEAYNNLGTIYQEIKQLDDAILYYKKRYSLIRRLPEHIII